MNHYDYREKRQFIQMATLALVMSPNISIKETRKLVNTAHELWDEIMTQVPEPKDDRDGA